MHSRDLVRAVREHPVICLILLATTLAGAALVPLLLGDDLSLTRRIIGGAVAGAGFGYFLTAARMIG